MFGLNQIFLASYNTLGQEPTHTGYFAPYGVKDSFLSQVLQVAGGNNALPEM